MARLKSGCAASFSRPLYSAVVGSDRYLPDLELPDRVRATHDMAEALRDRELVICAVPSHGVRDVMSQAAPHLPQQRIRLITIGLQLGEGGGVVVPLLAHGVIVVEQRAHLGLPLAARVEEGVAALEQEFDAETLERVVKAGGLQDKGTRE